MISGFTVPAMGSQKGRKGDDKEMARRGWQGDGKAIVITLQGHRKGMATAWPGDGQEIVRRWKMNGKRVRKRFQNGGKDITIGGKGCHKGGKG